MITGILNQTQIEVGSVLRILTGPTISGQRIPDTFAEALDGNNRVLQRVGVRRLRTQACGCGCNTEDNEDSRSGLIQVMLPDSENVAKIRLVIGDNEIWSRESTGERLEIENVSAEVENCELRIRWQTTASDTYPLERAVQWSDNEGRHWQALAIKLEEDSAVVPIQGFRFNTILVRIIVSNGFLTSESRPLPVEIPRCAPSAAILWPSEGATVSNSEPLRLWGLGTASDGNAVNSNDLHWIVDGQRVGSGMELWATMQDYDGEHEAILTVHDGELSASARVVFNATCSGRPPQRLASSD